MPVKIVSTKNLPLEQWLEYRKNGIGGSDAGAVAGLNPFKSPFTVYMEKTADAVQETEDNERMRQGRDLEDYCARRFSEATGLKVHRSNYLYRHSEHPFMIADLDRVIVGENAGLECKTASAWNADKWKSVETIPESYILQCQHYASVMNLDYMYIACLILGSEFVYYRIERDDDLIRSLITIEKDFWENNVLARAIPDPDGSKAYDEALSSFFTAQKESSIPLIGFDSDLARRKELTGLIGKMEKEKKTIDQKIKLFMQENEVAENSKYRVTWKMSDTTGSRRFVVKEAA